MSVASFGLEQLSLNVDEDYIYTLPSITTNNGGQITSITESDIEDNIEIQTASILNECADIEANLTPNLETLQEQTNEIEAQIIALQALTNDLLSNIDAQIILVNELIADITLASTGYEVILNDFNYNDVVSNLQRLNTGNFWKRRQKISLLDITLDAGIYVYTSNWNTVNIQEFIGGDFNYDNTDTRYKLSYAYVDTGNSPNENICSSLCHSSGHNGLCIAHSSSMCFELTETTPCRFGFMLDIASTTYTDQNDLTFYFIAVQNKQYPTTLSINNQIIQVIKIA